jgi:hypothetical protein
MVFGLDQLFCHISLPWPMHARPLPWPIKLWRGPQSLTREHDRWKKADEGEAAKQVPANPPSSHSRPLPSLHPLRVFTVPSCGMGRGALIMRCGLVRRPAGVHWSQEPGPVPHPTAWMLLPPSFCYTQSGRSAGAAGRCKSMLRCRYSTSTPQCAQSGAGAERGKRVLPPSIAQERLRRMAEGSRGAVNHSGVAYDPITLEVPPHLIAAHARNCSARVQLRRLRPRCPRGLPEPARANGTRTRKRVPACDGVATTPSQSK